MSMATVTVFNSVVISGSECSSDKEAPRAYIVYRGAMHEKPAEIDSQQPAASDGDTCSNGSRRRSSGDRKSNNLMTAIYSICCFYQFARYLPLLVLRVCFGPSQPPPEQKAQLNSSHRREKPSMRTLAGLLLIGLPLIVIARLPIIGRLFSALSSAPTVSRHSRSRRASSMSSQGTASRRSYSVCSNGST